MRITLDEIDREVLNDTIEEGYLHFWSEHSENVEPGSEVYSVEELRQAIEWGYRKALKNNGVINKEPFLLTKEMLKANGFFSIEDFNKRSTVKLDSNAYDLAYIYCENYYVAVKFYSARPNIAIILVIGESGNFTGGIKNVGEFKEILRFCGLEYVANNFQLNLLINYNRE